MGTIKFSFSVVSFYGAQGFLEIPGFYFISVAPVGCRFRFGLDPIAEHLAAIHRVEKLSGDLPGWERWMQSTEQSPGFPKEMAGFLVALESCVLAYREFFKVPEVVFVWLKAKTETVTEYV